MPRDKKQLTADELIEAFDKLPLDQQVSLIKDLNQLMDDKRELMTQNLELVKSIHKNGVDK